MVLPMDEGRDEPFLMIEEPEGAERVSAVRRDPVVDAAIKRTTSQAQLADVVRGRKDRLNYQEVVLAINHLCFMCAPAQMTVRTWGAAQVRGSRSPCACACP